MLPRNVELGVAIAGAELGGRMNELTDAKDQLRLAMKHMHAHWMFTDEEECFKIAVGVVMIARKDDSKFLDTVNYELRTMGALSAAISGIPVNFGAVLNEDIETIGLMGLWRETK